MKLLSLLLKGYIKDESQSINSYDYEDVVVEPKIIEKEVFKDIVVPEEKIVYKYIETNSNDTCEYNTELIDNVEVKDQEYSSIEEKNDIKKDIKFYVILPIILLLIIFLCFIMKDLIKKGR